MVTISADSPDDDATAKDFLVKKHASTKNYIIPADKKDAYFDALNPATVWKGESPYTLIVNEKGEVVYREHGALSFLKMRRAIVPELNRIKPWAGLCPSSRRGGEPPPTSDGGLHGLKVIRLPEGSAMVRSRVPQA